MPLFRRHSECVLELIFRFLLVGNIPALATDLVSIAAFFLFSVPIHHCGLYWGS
jgi:hypothetical protein